MAKLLCQWMRILCKLPQSYKTWCDWLTSCWIYGQRKLACYFLQHDSVLGELKYKPTHIDFVQKIQL